ncbi:3-methyl-2-oxobutanoate dehydrogenase subunit VorB [Bengtsoniella intestinalis]|uniref:3-methyl-2-oxobutanoate dehydrogenase subunit VorB n=1 Tax=Bengtsoniella intestinalis TaxID=3073143 RepID=UPI00391F9772
MTNNYTLMKGNEAIAEAAIRAGCRFYAGYPITPQSEILEYMAAYMPKAGGTFIQGESEIASMSMLWGAAACGERCMTSSSGPGYDLKQEGISYMASYNLPCVIADVMRYGIGDGEITEGQDSYWLATRGGGHGDSRQLVLAPASVQECADLTYLAFDLAEKYRNVAIILSDGGISQMIEKVVLPEAKEHDKSKFDWAIKGYKAKDEPKVKVTNLDRSMDYATYDAMMRDKFKTMFETEQRWENFQTEDAEIVLVAYGISSRTCKTAVRRARAAGMKLGLLRPITVWPFPRKAFEQLPDTVKALVTVEMSLSTQLGLDVQLATNGQTPLYSYLTSKYVPTAQGVVDYCQSVLDGTAQKMEVY